MPKPSLRSRTLGRIKKKVPGGASVIHYFRRKPSVAKCAICKKPLNAVVKQRPTKAKNTALSKKKPNRPYGGNLCPKCTKTQIKAKLR